MCIDYTPIIVILSIMHSAYWSNIMIRLEESELEHSV